MVRSILLGLSLILTPITGIWIKTTGEQIEAPCPSKKEPGAQRLPQRCKAPAPLVCITPSEYISQREEADENVIRLNILREEILAARTRAQRAEDELDAVLAEQEITNAALKAIHTPAPCKCSPIKNGIIGASLSLTACASAWATYQITRR